jgi:hypothetical protein
MGPLLQMTKCLVMGRGLLRVLAWCEFEEAVVVGVAQRTLLPVRLCPKLIGKGLEFGA